MDLVVVMFSVFVPARERARVERAVVDGAVAAARRVDPAASARWRSGEDPLDPTLLTEWLMENPGVPLGDASTRYVEAGIRGLGIAEVCDEIADGACDAVDEAAHRARRGTYRGDRTWPSAGCAFIVLPGEPEWDTFCTPDATLAAPA
ncbi:hypothetical protein P0W64_21100 [Tsukamurella sp. 8F]|uniref:hypothetical protein n=1 Tax=unclassified Tsukamurella TaxID=2633480 RepID=UPI0023B977C6|nr:MULTISPECIES: hypothetical protein [unclassified Tsukamurella]MDF0529620.1 hypothetical protein [Tsukamurella sp. 8J]MDF0589281.1 hypothetical protein [Tsukamurella sp. 8F]